MGWGKTASDWSRREDELQEAYVQAEDRDDVAAMRQVSDALTAHYESKARWHEQRAEQYDRKGTVVARVLAIVERYQAIRNR